MDALVRETTVRIFTDHAADPAGLWRALEENGLTLALVPERLGGAGLPIADGFAMMSIAGGAAAPVPFADTVMAGLVLSAAGIATPAGRLVAVRAAADTAGRPLDAMLHAVPFADTVDGLVCLAGGDVCLMAGPFDVERSPTAPTIGFDAPTTIALDGVPKARAPAPDWLDGDAIERIGAVARSAQMCGAMDAVLDLTLEHTTTREQFGRPLAGFQAIQHLLSRIAGEAAAASAATQEAIEGLSLDAAPDLRATATAKLRAGEAAGRVAAMAHQAHGAIGYTQDYRLGALTRSLWRWRDEFGGEAVWAERLGLSYLPPRAKRLTEEFLT